MLLDETKDFEMDDWLRTTWREYDRAVHGVVAQLVCCETMFSAARRLGCTTMTRWCFSVLVEQVLPRAEQRLFGNTLLYMGKRAGCIKQCIAWKLSRRRTD